MTGLDGAVNGKVVVGDGAVPDLMITLALSVKAATRLCQEFLDFAGIVGR